MKTNKFYSIVVLFIIVLISCKNDDERPELINEEELITTVQLEITEKESGTTQQINWKDGVNNTNDPKIILAANKKYAVKISFLDESNPEDIEDITAEVIEERDEHFIFYTPERSLAGFTIVSGDEDTLDTNNIGINITTDWTTLEAGGGKLTVFLIHEPLTKTGTNRSDFGGETDIEVSFEISIQ